MSKQGYIRRYLLIVRLIRNRRNISLPDLIREVEDGLAYYEDADEVGVSRRTILRELKEYSGHGTLLFPGVRSPERPIDISTITVSLRRRGYDGVKLSFDGIRSLAAIVLANRRK